MIGIADNVLKDIIVPCAQGYIDLLELQLPGKKRMDAPALLNGLKNSLNTQL